MFNVSIIRVFHVSFNYLNLIHSAEKVYSIEKCYFI